MHGFGGRGPENPMTSVETLKAEIKKLSSQSIQEKMNLHDLAEDLPTNWQKIPETAQRAFDAFKTLEAKRAELAELKAASAV